MLRSRFLAVLALVTPAVIALVAACADQTNESFPETTDAGGTTRRDGGGSTEEQEDSGTSTPKDSGAGKPDANCTAVAAPVEDGGGQCATIEFGLPAAPFGGLDAGDTGYNRGGVIPPGIYDAVAAEKGAGVGGSIRETLVVLANGRFTRIRQLDATGNGPGPLSRRSGSYKYSDAGVTFTYECATNDGAFIDAGSDTFPYEYVEGAGECQKGVYRFGLTSLRFTHQRR